MCFESFSWMKVTHNSLLICRITTLTTEDEKEFVGDFCFLFVKFRQTTDQDSSCWRSFSLAFFSLMHADLELFLCLSCDNRDSAYNTIHSHRPCCRRRPANRSDVQVQTSHRAHSVSFFLAPIPWQFLPSLLINSFLCWKFLSVYNFFSSHTRPCMYDPTACAHCVWSVECSFKPHVVKRSCLAPSIN